MRIMYLLIAFAMSVPDLALAQRRISAVLVNPSIDTSDAVTGAIVRTLAAYLQSPAPGRDPSPFWTADEQVSHRLYDLTAGMLYSFEPTATIVQITPADTTGRVFVVKTLFTLTFPNVPRQHVGLQRLYAIRSDSGWVLAGALGRLTAGWRGEQIGPIHYRFPSTWPFNRPRAQDAARFVDSVTRFLGVRLPGPIDYYLTESSDEMYRIMGFDWANQPSGPGTGQGALAGDRRIFVGSRTDGEAYYHELAHIVLFATLPPLGRQGLIDEGAATWLGGSRGRSYAQLLPFLVRIQNENPVLPFARVNELSDEDRDIAFYSTGALLVDAVYRANGMRGVRRLLSAGRADAELYAVLSETIGVTQAGFDAWWRAEAPRRAAEPPRPFWPQADIKFEVQH